MKKRFETIPREALGKCSADGSIAGTGEKNIGRTPRYVDIDTIKVEVTCLSAHQTK
jgi:hypothetical protein